MSNAYSRLFSRGAVSAPPRWLSVLVLLLLSRQATLAQSTTLAYTGAPQTYTVPAGVTRLQVTAKGAGHAFAPSGRGGLVTATLTVTPGEVLTLVVGGPGGIGGPGTTAGTGGYNGGGPGGTAYSFSTPASPGEGGSGATDLRRIPGATSASPLAGGTLLGTLNRRLLTAGGAGGKGTDAGANGPRAQNESGWAGTTSTGGAAGVPSALSTGAAGGYGTAGALGVGGTGGNGNSTSGGDGGSGGGGGYYGGGGGAGGLSNTGFFGGTGGGGSSYVEPTAVASGTAAPTYSLGTSGNGSVVLTPLVAAPTIRAFIPAVGPVGTSVVLNGSNLSGATAVSFNGTAASGYTVNAAGTELTVTVPAGATTGAISVTTPGGTASSANSFAVMATGPTTTFAFTGTFPSFTGAPQTYTVPAGVTQLQVIAEGVNVGIVPKGALVTARIQVTPGEVLTVVAGGPGLVAAGNGDPGAGGYNGGGAGGRATGVGSFTPGGEGGGGATDLRRIPGATSGNPLAGGSLTSTLANRLVVAGGAAAGSDAGTSPGATQDGGAGTTSSGGAGGVSFQGSSFNGYAGSLGQGGNGGTGSSAGGPGGGGGYYGGGGGAVNGAQYGAGGGGSSYVEPTTMVGGTTAVYALRSASFGSTSSNNGVLRLTPVYATPTITSFTPGSGAINSTVTLTGSNLGGATAVSFNGTAASGYTVNPAGTQLTVQVPSGATSGAISVTTPGGTATSASSFTVTGPAPVITSFTPAQGPVNMRVDISGSNFAGVSSVTFSGNGGPVAATISSSSAGLISVNVPAGAISGPIRVTTPGGTATSNSNFIVQPDPVVYSFSPASGPVGSQVVITGANFTGAQIVSFNTGFLFGTGFTVNSDNQITATVPASATTGPIGVNTGGSTGFSPTSFVVTAAAPVISSFTPNSGAAATSVTITGSNFTGATAVRFNGTSASYTVVSATQITTSVPAGASSGPLSVTTPGGTATSSTAFTVPAPNAAPTALALSNASVAENQPYNTLVGSFFTTDPNPSDTTHTYSLVTGVGSGGNGNFVISGRQLRTNATFDFETQASYPIRVRTTDAGGLWFERTFTISVSNLADLPTISSFTPTSGPAGTSVTVMGTNLFNLTGVSINNVAVTSPIISDPIAGDRATFNVPAGATTGLIRITTTAGTGVSATNFTVPAPTPSDLTVSSAQNISGSYNNVTITGSGAATLTGPLQVTGTLTVQTGGALLTNCQPVRGAGAFLLAAGASLSICDAAGIRASSSDTTGAIRLTGTRSFSPDATYRYNGTQFQFTGSGLPAQVRNLEVNNASGLWISQPVAVAQVLTLTNGNLNTNNQVLTLLSSASGTALVVNAGSGTVNGTTTVQRYISPALNAGLGYRHLASPVTFAPVSDLATASFAPVVNPAYNSSATPNLVTPFPTVFSYDQSRLASSPATSYTLFDRGWVSPSSLSSQLDPGKGYTVNLAGGQTVDFVGGLLTGNSFFAFSRGTEADAGWQLLGNPYPAPLDWSRVTPADRPGLNAAVYVYESTGPYVGRYRSYANGIGDTPIIPLGQAFFVRVADGQSSAALTLRNSHRLTTPDATPLLRGTADTRPQLELQLQGAGTADAAYVYFEQGATTGVDAEYDARKLPNTTGLNLAALAGTDALAVSGLPQLTGATVVPLQVLVPAAGTYTLAAAQLRNLAPGTQVLLHDAQTGQDTDLQQQPRYSFSTGTNPTGRFSLLFRTSAVTATAHASLAAQLSVFPNPTQGKFELRLAAPALGNRAEVVLYNSLGQAVQRQTLPVTANGLQATVDAAQLPTGVYTLRLTLANGSQLTKRVVKQ